MASSSATSAASRGALVVAACCLASFGEGIDLQAPGVTMPVLAPLFHLATGEGFVGGFLGTKSLFLSMSTFGLFFGAMIGGRLSDLIGRKWVLTWSVALFGVFSALTVQSTDAQTLLWMRFLTGLGLGGCYANMLAIAVENVSPSKRNTAVGVLYSAMPIGGATVSLASYAWANPEHWRNIYYLGAAVPLLAVPCIIALVPNLKPLAHATQKPSTGQALFGEGRGNRTLVLWLCFLSALITQYILLSWLPSLLTSKGLARPDAALAQMTYNLGSVPGSIIAGMLIDRAATRSASIIGVYGAGIVALVLLAIAPAQMPLSLAVAALVGLTVSGSQAIMYALAPNCYPTEVRGTGVGFAVAVGRVGSATGPLMAGAMLGAGLPPAEVLGVMAPLMALAGLCAWWIGRDAQRTGSFAESEAAALAANA
ncbi:MAG TPA: MFS transporter [Caulobacteraceae bacterium]|nr:MFS transporter [Caulobacteraceae bacterium]